jgi:aerobic carbon-monoxide dehydrogenase large subunit
VSILGTRVVRTEDPRFLTGGGVYAEDLVDERLAGACHLFFVRSPIAHARITAIDVSAARQAPGVIAVFTGADLAELPSRKGAAIMNQEMWQRPLATDIVRFVGEQVAVIATEELYQGEDAIELVSVDYDPLPAVVGFEAALADEVLLFEAAGTNTAAVFGKRGE